MPGTPDSGALNLRFLLMNAPVLEESIAPDVVVILQVVLEGRGILRGAPMCHCSTRYISVIIDIFIPLLACHVLRVVGCRGPSTPAGHTTILCVWAGSL
jgi:hypothetical protein